MIYNRKDIFWGGVLMGLSDVISSMFNGDFLIYRSLGIALIGATLYAIEIPNFYHWLEGFTNSNFSGFTAKALKAVGVTLFFNPLWIYRHFIFMKIFSLEFNGMGYDLVVAASKSFLASIMVALIGNYIVQNKINLKWRFVASSVLSVLLVVFYAISKKWFQ